MEWNTLNQQRCVDNTISCAAENRAVRAVKGGSAAEETTAVMEASSKQGGGGGKGVPQVQVSHHLRLLLN